jgi:hypothetical protein
LVGVAVLSIASASTAARADVLPNKMLGDWCYDDDHQVYTRDSCSPKSVQITLKRDGYDGQIGDGEGFGCEFKNVLRIRSRWDDGSRHVPPDMRRHHQPA